MLWMLFWKHIFGCVRFIPFSTYANLYSRIENVQSKAIHRNINYFKDRKTRKLLVTCCHILAGIEHFDVIVAKDITLCLSSFTYNHIRLRDDWNIVNWWFWSYPSQFQMRLIEQYKVTIALLAPTPSGMPKYKRPYQCDLSSLKRQLIATGECPFYK